MSKLDKLKEKLKRDPIPKDFTWNELHYLLSALGYKAISGEEYTQLAGLFVHFLRCKNSYIARYAPIFTP